MLQTVRKATPHDKIPAQNPPDRLIPAEFGTSVAHLADAVHEEIKGDYPLIARTFRRCFPSALATVTEVLPDNTTFVATGDIPHMWLRDAAWQFRPYVSLARDDKKLSRLIGGLIRRMAHYITIDPYANSFSKGPDRYHYWPDDRPAPGPWIRERKWSIDSPSSFLQLSVDYFSATGEKEPFTAQVHDAIHLSLSTMRTEQRHDTDSKYSFERDDPEHPTDTLPFGGRGTRTNFTGMVWSGFRSSDDPCVFGYNVPQNMAVVVALGGVASLLRSVWGDDNLAEEALRLRREIDFGIRTYGTVIHPEWGRIYAYETDGFGNHYCADDATPPSLLSIPYIGYHPVSDPLYQRTRAFVLSCDNPHYITGRCASGMGSSHPHNPAPARYIWPIGLIVQGMTSRNPAETRAIVETLVATTGGTGYMHEAFDADDPSKYIRGWCPWNNSAFGELVLKWRTEKMAAGQIT